DRRGDGVDLRDYQPQSLCSALILGVSLPAQRVVGRAAIRASLRVETLALKPDAILQCAKDALLGIASPTIFFDRDQRVVEELSFFLDPVVRVDTFVLQGGTRFDGTCGTAAALAADG